MKLTKYMGVGAAVMLMASCTTKFEEYNTNPYEPAAIPAVSLLSTMFQVYASPQQNDCQMNNTMWACHSGQVTTPTDWKKGDQLFAYYNPVWDSLQLVGELFLRKNLHQSFSVLRP